MSFHNHSSCHLEQAVLTQSLGYINSSLVLLHALPTFVTQCKRRQFTTPIPSLLTRSILACLTIPYGILICQWPVICSGIGSLLVFISMWIQLCVYKQQTNDITTQTKGSKDDV
jgi:hypothetical protein